MSAFLQLVSPSFNPEQILSFEDFMGRRASLVHRKGSKSGYNF